VTVRLSTWRGALPRAILLAVAIALVPLPALAGTTGQAAPQTLKASVAKIVAREAAASTPARTAGQAQQGRPADKSELGSPSFFKRPAGMICLAVVGAGTAYALYSASHDRIHSVVRQNQ
jgi:hypothetical protein